MREDDAYITVDVDANILLFGGNWTAKGIVHLQKTALAQPMQLPNQGVWQVEGSQIKAMDTAGAWVLDKLLQVMQPRDDGGALLNFDERYRALLKLVGAEAKQVSVPLPAKTSRHVLYCIGEHAAKKLIESMQFLAFIGEMVYAGLQVFRQPRLLQWTGLVREIDRAGYRALPIIALLSFLIGIVLAYQMGLQLKTYGANIFIVNLSGMAVLREFGPLITAIIVAGRTSSSFTAELGLMKVNEEIDALQTMGLSPIQRLVLPKIIGLVIALPLLTVWADVFGVFGSMVMSNGMLGLHFNDFLQRFQAVIGLSDYATGLVKAPVFALLIASVGCYQGFQVSSSADSVGSLTTKSVVQSIFLIIIADAGFSILFNWLGL